MSNRCDNIGAGRESHSCESKRRGSLFFNAFAVRTGKQYHSAQPRRAYSISSGRRQGVHNTAYTIIVRDGGSSLAQIGDHHDITVISLSAPHNSDRNVRLRITAHFPVGFHDAETCPLLLSTSRKFLAMIDLLLAYYSYYNCMNSRYSAIPASITVFNLPPPHQGRSFTDERRLPGVRNCRGFCGCPGEIGNAPSVAAGGPSSMCVRHTTTV